MSPLGKKIQPPPPEPKADVIERIRPGVIRRNGKFETDHPEPKPEPDLTPDVTIYGGAHWDAVIKGIQTQIADGFPLCEFGVL